MANSRFETVYIIETAFDPHEAAGDELQCDASHCPFDERVRLVMKVIRNHAAKTEKTVMYAFNVTGDLDEMRRRHDLARQMGGTCIMASLNSVGLAGMLELVRHTQLPIHAHRNGWGYLNRHPMPGWDYRAWQKVWRLAGVDHMHVNGIGNKFCESDDSVVRSAKAAFDVNGGRIAHAEKSGFHLVRVDPLLAADACAWPGEIERCAAEALEGCRQGRDPLSTAFIDVPLRSTLNVRFDRVDSTRYVRFG